MIKELIDKYDQKIEQIKTCTLFGEKVDMENPKEVAAAFYFLGNIKGVEFQREMDKPFINLLNM
jgi:hypothetical protein